MDITIYRAVPNGGYPEGSKTLRGASSCRTHNTIRKIVSVGTVYNASGIDIQRHSYTSRSFSSLPTECHTLCPLIMLVSRYNSFQTLSGTTPSPVPRVHPIF